MPNNFTKTTDMPIYETYVWSYSNDENTWIPFYVGQGIGGRSRDLKSRSSEFLQILNQYPERTKVEVYVSGVTERCSLTRERMLIKLYGRKGIDKGGILVNKKITPSKLCDDTSLFEFCKFDEEKQQFTDVHAAMTVEEFAKLKGLLVNSVRAIVSPNVSWVSNHGWTFVGANKAKLSKRGEYNPAFKDDEFWFVHKGDDIRELHTRDSFFKAYLEQYGVTRPDITALITGGRGQRSRRGWEIEHQTVMGFNLYDPTVYRIRKLRCKSFLEGTVSELARQTGLPKHMLRRIVAKPNVACNGGYIRADSKKCHRLPSKIKFKWEIPLLREVGFQGTQVEFRKKCGDLGIEVSKDTVSKMCRGERPDYNGLRCINPISPNLEPVCESAVLEPALMMVA